MLRKPLEKTLSLAALCSKMTSVSIRTNRTICQTPGSRVTSIQEQINGLPPPLTSLSEIPNELSLKMWVSSTGASLIGSRLPLEITIPLPYERPPIGIVNEKAPLYRDPVRKNETEIDDPLLPSADIIECPLTESNKIEKHAARLIVIRRIKMNKHKLRKLRKKMKFRWERVKTKRKIRKEKAFLDEKLAQLKMFEQFDAKQFVNDCIKRAKEEPIPRKWTDPLMPDWYRQQEMQKEEKLKRYKSAVNLYLNRGINFKPPPNGRYLGEKIKEKK